MDSNNNLSPGFVKMPLSGKNGIGKFTLIDVDDYEKLKGFRWFIDKGYVVRIKHYTKDTGLRTTKTIYLHREIMSPKDGLVVDHKNHDKLDNRKKNLRICTASENQLNNTAKGYCWDNSSNRWRVTVKEDGKYRCRYFESEEDAKKAVKMIRSGNIPKKRCGHRSKYMPLNISRNTPSGYYFRRIINGVTYRKFGFKSVSEAVKYRDAFLKEHNINSLRKENV